MTHNFGDYGSSFLNLALSAANVMHKNTPNCFIHKMHCKLQYLFAVLCASDEDNPTESGCATVLIFLVQMSIRSLLWLVYHRFTVCTVYIVNIGTLVVAGDQCGPLKELKA